MRFGLIFFSSREDDGQGERYRLVLEASRFADGHGWEAVWVPERHFTPEGCLFPNPAVVQAALARETRAVRLCAGSVVLPIHHPLRVAEEWAVVDNLSGGRVEISFASGWHPDDFVFFPERYARRREQTLMGIEQVRRLWRGEAICWPGVDGAEVTARIYPTPLQPELPIWLTAAGSPETFAAAGRLGAGVLTHLFNQELEELAGRIALYRQALAKGGYDPDRGRVAVMIHAALGADGAAARRRGEAALTRYLATATHLLEAIARSRGRPMAVEDPSAAAAADFASFWARRLIDSGRVLFGTAQDALPLVERLAACGVDELAVQVDFGLEVEEVLAGMPHLERLRELTVELRAFRPQQAGAAAMVTQAPRPPPANDRTRPRCTSDLAAVRARCLRPLPMAVLRSRMQVAGIELGEPFRGLERIWVGDGEALGEVVEPLSGAAADGGSAGFWDACLQVALAALPATKNEPPVLIPVGLGRFQVHGPAVRRAFSHARRREAAQGEQGADVTVFGEGGELIAEVSGLRLREMPPRQARQGSFYRMEWADAVEPPGGGTASAEAGGWIVVADRGGAGEALAERLQSAGSEVLLVGPESSPSSVAWSASGVAAGADAAWTEQRAGWTARLAERSWRGIVDLRALDAPSNDALEVDSLMAAQAAICGGALALAQALEAATDRPPPPLWLLTRGAQAVLAGEAPAVAQAPLWGLGLTIAEEVPGFRGGLLDLDPAQPAAAQADQVATELRGRPAERRLALRGAGRLTPRLRPWRPTVAPPPLVLAADGCYLLAGGLGDLGLAVARELALGGARRLALLGRTAAPPRECWPGLGPEDPWAAKALALQELEAMGVELALPAVDIADPQALAACLHDLSQQGFSPVRGVVQLAGVVQPAPLAACNLDSVVADLRAKVAGTWALHRALAAEPLNFFVAFSSAAGFLGPIAQGLRGYGAANAFLDSFAALRAAEGLPGLAIAWGPWSELGMWARWLATRRAEMDLSHEPRAALAALGEALARAQAGEAGDGDVATPPCLAYLGLDWGEWSEHFPASAGSSLLADLCPAAHSDGKARLGETLRRPASAFGGGDEQSRRRALEGFLATEVSRSLRVQPDRLDRRLSLTGLGIDSLVAFELKARLDRELGVPVSVGQLLGEQSLAALAADLFGRLEAVAGGEEIGVTHAPAERAGASAAQREPPPQASTPPAPASTISAIVERMPEVEVASLLERLLAEEPPETR